MLLKTKDLLQCRVPPHLCHGPFDLWHSDCDLAAIIIGIPFSKWHFFVESISVDTLNSLFSAIVDAVCFLYLKSWSLTFLNVFSIKLLRPWVSKLSSLWRAFQRTLSLTS